jgi:nuclear transport factor 2 (NTF2) superfamily protein
VLWRDDAGQWWQSHGNEHWEFDDRGLMRRRDASIDDYRIAESDQRIRPRDVKAEDRRCGALAGVGDRQIRPARKLAT